MKRLSNPEDPSTKEEKGRKKSQIYSREFQAMLDSLDREEECGDGDDLGPAPGEKKRRLSSYQVKALEKNFEVENKLEPERKARLAEELGLQPRQVAIWFQNRRARYKTKQLERDYGILRASYDSLKLDYDSLEHEKASLVSELRELKQKLHHGSIDCHFSGNSAPAGESPISDCVNNVSISENNTNGAGSEELKEEYPNEDLKEEHFVSSSTFYSPPAPQMLSWLQFPGQRPTKMDEQQGFVGGGAADESCNFFSVDQAPALHWYFQ